MATFILDPPITSVYAPPRSYNEPSQPHLGTSRPHVHLFIQVCPGPQAVMVAEGSNVSNTQLPLVCTGGFEASCEQEVGLCFVFLFLLLNYISLGFSCLFPSWLDFLWVWGPKDGTDCSHTQRGLTVVRVVSLHLCALPVLHLLSFADKNVWIPKFTR